MFSIDEFIGLAAALIAAISFGSYGVPMKGEAATKVDVDPLVFQSYKAFTVFATSTFLIVINNILADVAGTDESNSLEEVMSFQKWTFSDFTPWAIVSALFWVPGGAAGVYAIRRAGLAVSVGIWSCVIVMLSFIWGVLIFGGKQRSGRGALGAMGVLCLGLWGIAHFSSGEVEISKNFSEKYSSKDEQTLLVAESKEACYESVTSSLIDDVGQMQTITVREVTDESWAVLDFEHFPHCGAPPHSHETISIRIPASFLKFLRTNEPSNERTIHIQKYHVGLLMAIINGVLAATIMVPVHYAPANTTRGVGYNMSFGISAMLVVALSWLLRWGLLALKLFVRQSRQTELFGEANSNPDENKHSLKSRDCLKDAYRSLPSFHVKQMWRPGLSSGILYSIGNLCGIVAIQRLGNFMGYSLVQTSLIVSGLWGIFYYKEIPGFWSILGFLLSAVVVFIGILWLGHEHVG